MSSPVWLLRLQPGHLIIVGLSLHLFNFSSKLVNLGLELNPLLLLLIQHLGQGCLDALELFKAPDEVGLSRPGGLVQVRVLLGQGRLVDVRACQQGNPALLGQLFRRDILMSPNA